MNSEEQDALKAMNLALVTALSDAIAELRYALEYKDAHLVKKHKDLETVEELQEILDLHRDHGAAIFKEIQADAIESLNFPVMLRKMWSGSDVQEWLAQQAENARSQNGRRRS